MSVGKGKSAHTIIELLVSSALFIVLLGTLVVLLIKSNDYVRNAETKVEAQTQALAGSIWLSRNLTETNVTATTTVSTGVYPDTLSPLNAISFPSPREPNTDDVAWDKQLGGALVWRQVRFCYLDVATNEIIMKGFPIDGASRSVKWSGFPPYPAGLVDLDLLPITPFDSTIPDKPTTIYKVVAHNVRQLYIDVYQPTAAAPAPPTSANVVIESFVPSYGLNYGVRVQTGVRLQN